MKEKNPAKFGWKNDERNKTMIPVFSGSNQSKLPSQLDKLLAWSRSSNCQTHDVDVAKLGDPIPLLYHRLL